MVNPVPNHSVTTAYKKMGSLWTACGWHTGQDYAAPAGTSVVAARAGIIAYVNYGSAFGNHQFAVRPGDGTEDLYAHMQSRPMNYVGVAAGQHLGGVGSEGNSTAPHLHFERHKWYGWDCGCFDDPMKSHNDQATGAVGDDDDMLIINSDGRQPGLVGAGYFKELTDEEYNVMKDMGVREALHSDRGYDVARAACLYGSSSM